MKLVRIGKPGQERPGVIDDETWIDLGQRYGDFDAKFFENHGLEDLKEFSGTRQWQKFQRHPLEDSRYATPLTRPGQILCVGLNYRKHAIETGQDIPTAPIIFNKAPNTFSGANDDVKVPRGSSKMDWEVELSVLIGRRASYLEDVADARSSIAGYMLANDLSERAFQLEGAGQWVLGKSCPGFNPVGPYLVTPDEIGHDPDIVLSSKVNGIQYQKSRTSDMIFSPSEIVMYLSRFMVLEPGDVINTGTPSGVGMGQQPPRYLHGGDVVELDGGVLGSQRQLIRASDVPVR